MLKLDDLDGDELNNLLGDISNGIKKNDNEYQERRDDSSDEEIIMTDGVADLFNKSQDDSL